MIASQSMLLKASKACLTSKLETLSSQHFVRPKKKKKTHLMNHTLNTFFLDLFEEAQSIPR